MRWPDPTNSDDNILTFILTDPAGRLAQLSYDYGASNGNNASPDIQHSTVEHPMPGKWTAQIVWANGRGHVQTAPDTPGPYTGTVTFQASGQNFTTMPGVGARHHRASQLGKRAPQHRPSPYSWRCS